MKASKDTRQLIRWQIVYNALVNPRKAEDIAVCVGASKSLVQKMVSRYNREGAHAIEMKNCGGRYHEYLSPEEEIKFLAPFFQKAERGELTTVREIHIAYEEYIGNTAHETTIYRLLERHNWRKLLPRSVHPKADKQAQEDFKKNCPFLYRKRSKIENRMMRDQSSFWSKTRLVLAVLPNLHGCPGTIRHATLYPPTNRSTSHLCIYCCRPSIWRDDFSYLANCQHRNDDHFS